jgi:hypothetical protein
MLILSDFTNLLGKLFKEMGKDAACACLWGEENEFETYYRHPTAEENTAFTATSRVTVCFRIDQVPPVNVYYTAHCTTSVVS